MNAKRWRKSNSLLFIIHHFAFIVSSPVTCYYLSMFRAQVFPAAVSAKSRIIASHIGFVFIGVVTTMLALLLPALSARWSLDDAQAGNLFTAQFVGSIIGAGASSRLALRFGRANALVVGFALIALGVAGLNARGYAAGLAAIVVYGVGLGLTIPTTNLLVSDAFPKRRAAALNILNFAWSAGAVLTPFVLAPLLRNENPQTSLFALSLAFALLALFFLGQAKENSSAADEGEMRRRVHLTRRQIVFVPLFAMLFFTYVGTETAVGGWSASLALRFERRTDSYWAFAPSAFWAAILTGRALSPLFLRFLSVGRLILCGLAVALIGIGVMLLTRDVGALFCGVVLAGFGFAPVFPSLVALLPQCFAASAPRIAGYFFAVAPFGGATIPFLTGWISQRVANLQAGLATAAACGALMLGAHLIVLFLLERNSAAASETI
jgi:FHS family glucose/mannose:H+ symporter-like MFS transporter